MTSEKYTNQLCLALDVFSADVAKELIAETRDYVGAFKIGLQLVTACTYGQHLPNIAGRPFILDLKFHDIPETVALAVKAAGDMGAFATTLHIQQRATLEAAVRAAEEFKMRLLGVTVLTSMKDEDLDDLELGPGSMVANRVLYLASFALGCGIRDLVCSPKEVGTLSRNVPGRFLLVPGIRLPTDEAGDQVRIGTPHAAIRDGASMIVVGRPIRDAPNRAAAAQAILDNMHGLEP